MLQDVPAMVDCTHAIFTLQFTDGRTHTSTIDLAETSCDMFDALNFVSEFEYMLYRYQQDGIHNHHDVDAWIDLCLGGTGCVYPTDEQSEAAETIVAIFDTYLSHNSTDLDDYAVTMVDHQGNRMPYEIERNNI